MTEQLDLEDWLRENPANSDDTRKTAEMAVSKMENTTQTNNDDLDDYTKMYFTLKGDILALELLLKECRGSVVVSLENAVMCEMRIFNLIITTKKKQDDLLEKAYFEARTMADKLNVRLNWTAINPVIHDLEKLRANTWDQDKITHIQQWLRDNFEVKDAR